MQRSISQRFLSAFLAMVLLLSCSPMAYAAETEGSEEIVAMPEQTELAMTEPETLETTAAPETEPAQTESVPEETEAEETVPETAVPQVTVPEETVPEETVPEETVPAETVPEETIPEETVPEETVPEETVPEETIPEETVPEETVPEEEAVVFPGMPEGYVLSEEELTKKQEMIRNEVLETLLTLVAGENYVADEIIVAAESQEQAEVIAAAFGGELLHWGEGLALIRLTGVSVVDAVTASLNLEQNLPAASPNYIHKIDPIIGYNSSLSLVLPEKQSWQTWVQENMTNPDPALLQPDGMDYQWMHDAVDSYAAWGVTTGESWVKVAVLDSGVQANHPDLRGHVVEYNVGKGTGDPNGHGTHVAGIIAATMDNGQGGVGIAPGVTIMSYRITDAEGDIESYPKLQAIRSAINNGAHIINMSFGGFWYDYEEANAIATALYNGVTVVAAMGNDGSNTINYPAAYDGVIGVAATNSAGTRAWYSNYGDWADISAPGDSIYSTYIGSSYSHLNGTSMATPVVAGVAALYTSAVGYRVAPAEMEKVLKKSATKIADKGMGAGLVNAANLFGAKPDAPFFFVTDYDWEYLYDVKYEVPCEGYLVFCETEELAISGTEGDMSGVLVYTLDGKTPAVKNGEVTVGQIAGEPARLDLYGYAGETVTVKAAFVNGMGVMGKVATVKLKVAEGNRVKRVTIQGPATMIAGKSVTLTATVTPQDGIPSVDQSVTWTIYNTSASMVGAKIHATTGKLTVPSGRTGWVRVRAYSNANSSYYATHEISVQNITPVAKITMGVYDNNGRVHVVNNPYTYVGQVHQFAVASMTDKYGYPINPSISGVSWSSSNTKVATVDQNGVVRALSKGNATITCTSMDGSNKSAKVKLVVKQQVEDLEIVSNPTIAPGSSTTLKVNLYPANVNNKKVTWQITSNNMSGQIVVNRDSGKLTVGKNVREGTNITVTATTTDDDEYKLVATYSMRVQKKISSIYIETAGYSTGYAPGPIFDSKGNLKTVELFSVDLPNSSGVDNGIQLRGVAYGPSNQSTFYADWSTSDASVATVENGYVTAHKAGTAKITLTAVDGSNKKTTCTVKVLNPASSISIATNAPQMTNRVPYVGMGKSVKNTVTFVDTYGKPSNQKVNWAFEVNEYDVNGYRVEDHGYWTSFFRSSGLISVKNGVLNVKAAVRDYWMGIAGEFEVTVYAMATDGTGAMASITYAMIPLTKTMAIDTGSKKLYTPTGSAGFAYFYSDQWNLYQEDTLCGFVATSSNPQVASVAYIVPDEVDEGWYKIYYATPGKAGSATITIKTTDGSNKSCSFKVTAY